MHNAIYEITPECLKVEDFVKEDYFYDVVDADHQSIL